MRVIKLAVLSFIFLFLIITAISLLIPSHIRISKAINLAPPKDSIFALIKDQKRWPQWHPAFMKKHTSDSLPPISVIQEAISDSEVIFSIRQENHRPVINGWKLYQYPSTDSVTLQWYMDFHMSWYPWEKFGSLFYENTYGVMMEQGLSDIKKLRINSR